MEIRKPQNWVLKGLKDYDKEVEIVEGLLKPKHGNGYGSAGYGCKKRGLQETLPPEKKKRLNNYTKIDPRPMDSLEALHTHHFLKNPPPSKQKIMSVGEDIANHLDAKLNPWTKTKATDRYHIHSHPTMRKRNFPMPLVPQRISLVLYDERQTVSKLPKPWPLQVSDSKQSTSCNCPGKIGKVSSILEYSSRTRRAAGAAELKTRFAATILKAQEYLSVRASEAQVLN